MVLCMSSWVLRKVVQPVLQYLTVTVVAHTAVSIPADREEAQAHKQLAAGDEKVNIPHADESRMSHATNNSGSTSRTLSCWSCAGTWSIACHLDSVT